MKKSILALLVITVLSFFPVLMMGETSSIVTADAKVRIIEIIKLTKVDDMNFGKIINGNTGSVLLTTSGNRSAIGANIIGESGWFPAKFEVRGTNDFEYFITLPSIITLKNGDNELKVENLVAKPSSSSEDALIGIIKSDSYFTVGGKLVISSYTLPSGIYTSSFDVSVGYN
jgi:hypothetical protein